MPLFCCSLLASSETLPFLQVLSFLNFLHYYLSPFFLALFCILLCFFAYFHRLAQQTFEDLGVVMKVDVKLLLTRQRSQIVILIMIMKNRNLTAT